VAAAAPAAAAALPVVKGGVGGGERLPAAGKCPPTVPASAALAPAALRTGLGPALLSAAAKSWPLPPEFTELAAPAALGCAGSDAMGVCDTGSVAFISLGIASHVPDDLPPMPRCQRTCAKAGSRLGAKGRPQRRKRPRPAVECACPSAYTISPREIVMTGHPRTCIPSYGV